jgi:hypothetical protein
MSVKPPNYTKMSDKEYYDYLKQQNQGKPLYDPKYPLDKESMDSEVYNKALKEMYREEWAQGDQEKDFDSWETANPDKESKRVLERNKMKSTPKINQAKLSPKEQLNVISQLFLNRSDSKYSKYEMEAKFGTRGIKPITKLDYDNVVKKLKSLGFISANEVGSYSLKIQPEFIDVRTGDIKTTSDFDRFRIEIEGLTSIQEYCKTNDLKLINDKHSSSVNIMRKTDVKPSENADNIGSANFDEFNFRVSLKNEETISKTGKIGLEIFSNWNRSKKVFRYINRVSFIHKDESIPFQMDLSIVRTSNKNEKKWLIPTATIDESNVFDNPEIYEIEIEVLPTAKVLYHSPQELSSNLQKMVKNILSGLQRTNYPISYTEQKDVMQSYLKLLFEESARKKGENYVPKDRVYPSDFIGPSLKTLEVQNVGPLNPDIIVPNITEPYAYCVTEKADGDRHLLFVNSVGKIYLINMNMNVIFTGAKTEEEKCFNSLLDGELILHNKRDQFINTFAAFDIYYINNTDVRARPFVKTINKDEKYFTEGCRLPMLKDFMKILKPISITAKHVEHKSQVLMMLSKIKGENKSPMTFISKNYYPTFDVLAKDIPHALGKYNIFEANNYLLRRIADNLFDYEIDGLIFQPTLLGVGSNKFLEAGPKKKVTWTQCFKWKPSEATSIFPHSYNTIDFLVFTKKDAANSDIITPIFENGINVYESTQFNQYKTLILAVGYDQAQHGYINPCQDVLDDKFVNSKDIEDEAGYKPKQFYPTNPYDPLAGLCNVMLELDTNGTYQMFTEERQVFEDQMVVEFRYDMTKPGLWKWVPMRVRYDKTADYRAKQGVGANDYNTANYNWTSIHNPVTEKMIATGEGIPGLEVSDDVYYNSVTTDKMTQGMRDFHNLYVKKILIQGVARRGNTLIDFACGKAGDLPKWIAANLSFVFGIDISKDNLENKLNGACARFLNYKKTTKVMPYALFVNGNSALNIRSGTNMFSDKANEITKSVFGSIGESRSLGPAVSRQHAIGMNGFDISSCQFALHYMFENKSTFYNFIRNIAECTRLNGYFVATCYDGRTIFNMLKKKELGESRDIYIDDKKVWSITKDYAESMFEDNESCLGYKISVYQDSINQTIPEYLVNFDFLTQTMDKYGFSLVTREEAKSMGLPEGSGMFSELFNSMMLELKRDPKKESDYKDGPYMKQYEKDISFLNRFFVYKKVSTRNAEKLTKALIEQLPDQEELELSGTVLAREAVQEAEEAIKPKAKKLGKKINLQEEAPTKKNRKMKEVVEVAAVSAPVIEEVIELPSKPKKTTRKKKIANLELVEE